jgi:hypothetical protein
MAPIHSVFRISACRVFALGCALALAVACSSPKDTFHDGSAIVRGPAKARWPTASVEVQDIPLRYDSLLSSKHGDGNFATIKRWLRLDGPEGHRDLQLSQAYISSYEGRGTAPEVFESLRRLRTEIRYSPDAAELALSDDKGRHWRFIRIDTATPECNIHTPGSRDPANPLPFIAGDDELYLPGPSGDPFRGAAKPDGTPRSP